MEIALFNGNTFIGQTNINHRSLSHAASDVEYILSGVY